MLITDFLLRLGFAFICGSLIGAERQTRQKNAGLRTNTLVCIGSAAFILLSFSLTGKTGDPSRIAAQVVTGVGFLGGGLILKDGFSVRGLNTAATIWCSAAVGALSGCGLFWQGAAMVIFVISTNCLLRPIGTLLGKHAQSRIGSETTRYEFKIRCKEQIENHLRVMMLNAISNDPQLQMRTLKSTDDEDIPNYCFVIAEIYSRGNNDVKIEKLAAKLTIEYGVTQVSWELNTIGDC